MATNPLGRKTKSIGTSGVSWYEFWVSILLTFVAGWVLMLLVGIVHHEWLPDLPTLGYWPSLLIAFMLDWLVNLLRFGARVKLREW